MPPNADFQHISMEKIHPTFGAQVSGVDLSTPLADDVFDEIYRAISLVNRLCIDLETHMLIDAAFLVRVFSFSTNKLDGRNTSSASFTVWRTR